MSWIKRIERAERRLLLKLMAHARRRRRPLPPDLDLDHCKILFLRHDRIGDALVFTPLLAALKEQRPGATVDVLLGTKNAFALDGEPLIRRRWVLERNLPGVVRLLRAIRAERYDFVVDLLDNPSAISTVLLSLTGGRWNVGFAKQNAYAYDVVVPQPSKADTHVADRMLAILGAFGLRAEGAPRRIRYHVADASRAWADDFWRRHALEGATVIGVNISASAPERSWGDDDFRALLPLLRRELPFARVLLLFHPADRARAEAIASPSPDVLLSPPTHAFDQFAALVERLSLLVTADTSAVQLAAAFRVPAAVLYARQEGTHLWTPYGSIGAALEADSSDLRTIPPETVLDAVRRLAPSPVPEPAP